MRGEDRDSAGHRGAWSLDAAERACRHGGGGVGCVALLFWVWFFGGRLGAVDSREYDRRGGEIRVRAADVRFRLRLDRLSRDCCGDRGPGGADQAAAFAAGVDFIGP